MDLKRPRLNWSEAHLIRYCGQCGQKCWQLIYLPLLSQDLLHLMSSRWVGSGTIVLWAFNSFPLCLNMHEVVPVLPSSFEPRWPLSNFIFHLDFFPSCPCSSSSELNLFIFFVLFCPLYPPCFSYICVMYFFLSK